MDAKCDELISIYCECVFSRYNITFGRRGWEQHRFFYFIKKWNVTFFKKKTNTKIFQLNYTTNYQSFMHFLSISLQFQHFTNIFYSTSVSILIFVAISYSFQNYPMKFIPEVCFKLLMHTHWALCSIGCFDIFWFITFIQHFQSTFSQKKTKNFLYQNPRHLHLSYLYYHKIIK